MYRKKALTAVLCMGFIAFAAGGADATKPVNRKGPENPLHGSRIQKDVQMRNANGYLGVSEYNHPTDDFRVASAMGYVRGWLGGEPEYFSLLERGFSARPPKEVWNALWAFSIARPAERAAFGAGVVQDVTVEGDRIVALVDMPDIWGIMNERAPDLPETIRQWAFMDALGENGALMSKLPRKNVWIEIASDVTGRFKMTGPEMAAMLSAPEQDIRDALAWIAQQRNVKSKVYIPAYGKIAGQQVKLSNRTVKLASDVEMGLVALADGTKPGYEKAADAPKVKKMPRAKVVRKAAPSHNRNDDK